MTATFTASILSLTTGMQLVRCDKTQANASHVQVGKAHQQGHHAKEHHVDKVCCAELVGDLLKWHAILDAAGKRTLSGCFLLKMASELCKFLGVVTGSGALNR